MSPHTQSPSPRSALIIATASIVALASCSQESDPIDVPATDGAPATTGGEPGVPPVADDTSPPMGTAGDDELVNACLPEPVEGLYGFVHQCEGVAA